MSAPRLAVPIRPEVGMYSAFARLNYRPWFAIAEFVDNALQSYLSNRDALREVARSNPPLKVEVRIEPDLIRVSDNAAGIARGDMDRAFAPALPPPDRSGLSEFGIGMKAAACWFAHRWSVRTASLGEAVERTVRFDVPSIVKEGTEELWVDERKVGSGDHFTVIELTDLRVRPKGRTVSKIREHLASIYRVFLRRGELALRFETPSISESLEHAEPEILEAPYFAAVDGKSELWRKELEMDVGQGQRLWGWAGLLAKASTKRAGFSVFRRDRLIQGSADESWRPERIFRTPNTYTFQRLVGELHVDGFEVTHTKDGIQWGEVEDAVLALLYEMLDEPPLPLIRQAEGHRVRKRSAQVPDGYGQRTLETVGEAISGRAGPILDEQVEAPAGEPEDDPPPAPAEAITSEKVIEIQPPPGRRTWRIKIEITRDPAEDWYTFYAPTPGDGAAQSGAEVLEVTVRLNLGHPFSEQFLADDEEVLEPIVRIVAGLALAETTAREAGTRFAGRVRRHLNELLRSVLVEGTGR